MAIVAATGLAALVAGMVLGEVVLQISRWLDGRAPKRRDRYWPSKVDRRPPFRT